MFLPGEIHGQRSLLGCSPWGRKELDMTERHHNNNNRGYSGPAVKNLPANARDAGDVGLTHGLGRSCGGGSGNPPQYSCLENSVDRGAWWATVHRGRRESDTTRRRAQAQKWLCNTVNILTVTQLYTLK